MLLGWVLVIVGCLGLVVSLLIGINLINRDSKIKQALDVQDSKLLQERTKVVSNITKRVMKKTVPDTEALNVKDTGCPDTEILEERS